MSESVSQIFQNHGLVSSYLYRSTVQTGLPSWSPFFSDNSKFLLGEVESLGVTRLHINHLKGLGTWPEDDPAVQLCFNVMLSGRREENVQGVAEADLQQLCQWEVVMSSSSGTGP